MAKASVNQENVTHVNVCAPNKRALKEIKRNLIRLAGDPDTSTDKVSWRALHPSQGKWAEAQNAANKLDLTDVY